MKLMRRRDLKCTMIVLASVLSLAACSAALAGEASQEGWTPLFDGQTLTGWTNPYTWGKAWAEDGQIVLQADKKFFLVTEKQYRDFIFEGEVKMPEGTSNSGFMFRCHVQPNNVFGYQAEVDPSARQWSGGLYDEGRRGLAQSRSERCELREGLRRADQRGLQTAMTGIATASTAWARTSGST